MDQTLMLSIIIFGSTVFILLIILLIMKKSKKNKFKKLLADLEYQKNEISSVPVGPELAKVETYLKNE